MSSEDSQPRKRSAAEIQADLERARRELTATVDEISDRIDPRRQAKAAAESGRKAAEGAAEKAQKFAEDVRDGDPRAVRVAGGIASAVAAVIGLALIRRNR